MKKIIVLVLCFAFLLSACSPAASAEPIEPGERIGNFLITTAEEAVVVWEQDCVGEVSSPEASVYTCTAPVGTVVLIGTGLFDDTVSSVPSTATPHLEELWSAFTYEMTIEGRPVDLQAFGIIEFFHPQFGVIRFWSVALVSDQPGEIVVRESGVAGGESFASVTTFRFTAP